MSGSDVFLSYSHNDRAAALNLRAQLERHGLAVFRDDESIRAGDLWLNRLQEAMDGCAGFVVLVGRDGVARWVGAETQVALNRYFGPHDEAQRLPIFPVLIDSTTPESLPAFLRLFQATPWKWPRRTAGKAGRADPGAENRHQRQAPTTHGSSKLRSRKPREIDPNQGISLG